MGELLRRYWHPVAAVSEFGRASTKQVRLLGEDMVLTCGRGGEYVVSAPGHPGCSAAALGGLVWVYAGPDPAPLIPRYEAFSWPHGFVQIVFSVVPCNWFQCQENAVDPVHFEWLHMNWSAQQSGNGAGHRGPAHVDLEFAEFRYGIVSGRRTIGPGRRPQSAGLICLWPNVLYTGNHFEWRVPMDDTTTLSVTWWFTPVPTDVRPYHQPEIPHWYGPVADPVSGRWITTHTLNQDFAAWLGQGPVTDRTAEHLGRSDAGIILLRRRFLADLDRMSRGEDPTGVVRDERENDPLVLPIDAREREELRTGWSRSEFEERLAVLRGRFPGGDYYSFQVGQPPHVRAAFEDAMGIRPRVR
jgi:5,5'-dehydrodivanillate O-demethylase